MAVADVPATRDADGRYKKGVSGNPGGRRQGVWVDFRNLILDETHDGKDLVASALRDLVNEKSWNARAEARRFLAEYGFGKPAQPVTGEDGGPIQINLVEMAWKIHQTKNGAGGNGHTEQGEGAARAAA